MRLIVSMIFIAIFYGSLAQFKQSKKSPTVQFLQKRGYEFPDTAVKEMSNKDIRKWPDTLYYNTT